MKAFRGTVVSTPAMGQVVLADSFLIVDDASGKIVATGPGEQQQALCAKHHVSDDAVTALGPQQMLVPGFIDTHIHAPQYKFTGTATDTPLFEWLSETTFPCEAALAGDTPAARDLYARLVRRTLSLGTTTAAYFTVLDAASCKAFASVVADAGQRALLGKVCMDQNGLAGYVETTTASLAAAADVVAHVEALAPKDGGRGRLLTPAVIPRFVPTCSPELLSGLGALAAATPGAAVLSHISESRDQVAFSAKLYPEVAAAGGGDADVYAAHGLLRRGAVFAHGTQLGARAMARMAEAGAAIAHCPLSNFYFGDDLLDVKAARAAGVHVGLATDVAGGYSPSMLVAMRSAVLNSHAVKVAALHRAGRAAPAADAVAAHVLGWRDALWLATAGGADAVGLGGVTGALEAGREFDALLVDAGNGAAFDAFGGGGGGGEGADSPEELLEKFINLGDDRHIQAVYVQGRLVHGAAL